MPPGKRFVVLAASSHFRPPNLQPLLDQPSVIEVNQSRLIDEWVADVKLCIGCLSQLPGLPQKSQLDVINLS